MSSPVPASAVKIVGWVHEDELPQGYPYDAMFPHSRVDGVRMFPVFAPVPAPPAEAEGVEALANACGAEAVAPGGRRSWEFDSRGLHEFARRLRNSPQPVSNGPFGAFYVCPTCSGTAVVTQSVHDAARSAGGDDA